MTAITIFVAQLLFQLARTYNQRVVSRDNVTSSVIASFFIQALWLITTALGVKSFNESDPIGITSYMIGGILGVYLSFKVPIKEKETKKK